MKPYIIYSPTRSAYWATDSQGYVAGIRQAGRYTGDEAARIASNNAVVEQDQPDHPRIFGKGVIIIDTRSLPWWQTETL